MIKGKMGKRTNKSGKGTCLWHAGQQKKEPGQTVLRLTKGNQADFLGIFFTRAEYLILTLLAHSGDQELFL